MKRTRTHLTCLAMIPSFALTMACGPEKPPAPSAEEVTPASAELAPETGGGPQTAILPADPEKVVLTYAGPRGVFADAAKPEAVAEEARGMVRVTLLDGPAPPPGKVWVANLRSPAADGSWPLSTVARDSFEELAVGQGLSAQVEIPPGIEPPEAKPAEGVIVYKTEWCGVCTKLLAYLDRKGVDYVAKDIEKDSAAAGELQAKAREKGIKTGSVPVIDVGGELMVGFDRARLEQLL